MGGDESTAKRRGRIALAVLLLVTGVLHFVVPEPYVRIIPKALPDGWARPLVYVSGAAEVAAGVLLLRGRAGWFAFVLLLAVFPANVQMALDDPNPLTIGRLPLQLPLLWAATPARRPRS